jgi:predicted nucleotidyltransferase
MVEDAVVSAVRRYLAVLPTVGIHASRAVLYGSFARGEGDQLSDIDLVVIAPEFDAERDFDTIKNLWETTLLADNRIEPIPCGEREWDSGDGRPIIEIARREGVVIEPEADGGAPEAGPAVTMKQIEEFGRRIGEEFGAEKVILFGSYARGTASAESDVDLLVVAHTSLPPQERYGAVRRLLADCPAGFDIVVKTPEEYDRWRSVVNHIVYFADKYGRVLYERSDS